MDKSSRTYKSLLNSVVAFGLYLISLLLQFFSRKTFVEYLGTEVLGLNTTVTSLLSFLNLAELGVGTAIAFSLYKPLGRKDYSVVNEIVSVQGWLYRKIAGVVILGSLVLMLFFPGIFGKMELPLWYAYASFCALLFSSLLSYYVNYKEIVLTANQQEYKVQLSFRVVLLIKILLQIIFIRLFDNGYIWWLLLEIIFSVLASIALNYTIKVSCPYLKTSIKEGRELKGKYPEIISKIKQFFFHKIATFVLTQTSPIIIYGYASLSLVAIYGNYMLIVTGLSSMLNAIFSGMAASVGNLVSSTDNNKIIKIFRELFSSRFLLTSTLGISIFLLSDCFMHFWVGDEFYIDKASLACISLIFYFNTQRSVVDNFINAYGLFKDIWAPIVEAILNISISILFGHFWGLPGILSGVIISHIIIVFCWKPFFLFSQGFHMKVKIYIILYTKHIIAFFLAISATLCAINHINIIPTESISSFILYSLTCCTCYFVTLFIILYAFEEGMRSFAHRLISINQ